MATKTVKRILNCLPSHGQERDWLLEDARAAGALAAARIPVRKDLRQTWWAIGDQGETGSCVGWAAADSVLRWHFVQAGTLGKAEPLSVRFVWMAAKETDEFVGRPTTFIESDGTSLKAALDIARKYGAVADELLPFGKGALFPGRAETFYATASRLRIASYFNLDTDPAAWREWLAGNGPVLTRLDVDATWDDATKTKGVLKRYQPSTARGGHAVALVGYTEGTFIVRNSWGTAWGDCGFAHASEAYAKAAFTEAYGVAV